ncbi:hypothetical protein GA0111570_102166 [Raineyella antarctica]|uniref:Pyridoxamine 5'-phosphate oxidase putative domain-containing protein n=1 Tax=Raineyella antarctica TaxID=1577474 RepID=A0A1G6GGR5_9ACTN|nr:hypothetical protein [Raineyella antarctica]SDB80376.1 hypothetical protein GA0111570_102166 [Raineyella antarctica]
MGILADADHVLVTAYDTEGGETSSVERVVELADHRVAYWLPDGTGAAERFAAAPVVSVRACSRTGRAKVTDPLLEGRASVVADGPLFDEAKAAIKEKYGLGAGLSAVMDRARELVGEETPEAVVVIDIVA